jgi:hypothetical protein
MRSSSVDIAASTTDVLQVQHAQMDARPFKAAQTATRKTGAGPASASSTQVPGTNS